MPDYSDGFTELLKEDVDFAGAEWRNEYIADDYPVGSRMRGKAWWQVIDIRGGNKSVQRQTQRTDGGRWRGLKKLTSGDTASIAVMDTEYGERAFPVIYDEYDSGRAVMKIHDGTMTTVARITFESLEDVDDFGLREGIRALLPKKEAPKPKAEKGKSKGRGTEFKGVGETDGKGGITRPTVRGTLIGEWGVYKQEDSFSPYRVAGWMLFHHPTGYQVRVYQSDPKKKVLYVARRLDKYVPKDLPENPEDWGQDVLALIGELRYSYIRSDWLRNSGELKPEFADTETPPRKLITHKKSGDDEKAAELERLTDKLRHLTKPPMSKAVADMLQFLRSSIHRLKTGRLSADNDEVASEAVMKDTRKKIEDSSSEMKWIRGQIAKRKPEGQNYGDYGFVTISGKRQRAVTIFGDAHRIAIGVSERGVPFGLVVETSSLEPREASSRGFVLDMLRDLPNRKGQTPTNLDQLSVDVYKAAVLEFLEDGDPRVVSHNSISSDLGVNDMREKAVRELVNTGMIVHDEGASTAWSKAYKITDLAKKQAGPNAILEYIKKTVPMLPPDWEGALPVEYCIKKFPDMGGAEVIKHVRTLEALGRVKMGTKDGKAVATLESTKAVSPSDIANLGTGAEDGPTEGEKKRPSVQNAPSNPANSEKHYHEENGRFYVDTWVLNHIGEIWPAAEIRHMGMGEFSARTPEGDLEFDRMRGVPFEGQSGNSFWVYGPTVSAMTEFKKYVREYFSKRALDGLTKKEVGNVPEGFDGFEAEDAPVDEEYDAIRNMDRGDFFALSEAKSVVYRVIGAEGQYKGQVSKLCVIEGTAERSMYMLTQMDVDGTEFGCYAVNGSGTRVSSIPKSKGSVIILPRDYKTRQEPELVEVRSEMLRQFIKKSEPSAKRITVELVPGTDRYKVSRTHPAGSSEGVRLITELSSTEDKRQDTFYVFRAARVIDIHHTLESKMMSRVLYWDGWTNTFVEQRYLDPDTNLQDPVEMLSMIWMAGGVNVVKDMISTAKRVFQAQK